MPYLSMSIILPESASSSETSDGKIAMALARRSSQPCPDGDIAKAAIGRAADRTGIPFSRIRDIWYGDARRIEAREMDQLRAGADAAEMDIAVAGIEMARRRLQELSSPLSREAIAALDRTVCLLGRGPDTPRRRASDRR